MSERQRANRQSNVLALCTASVEETRAVAGAVAELATVGDLVLLAGEMGAGKTAFAQGFGAALGVTDPITSPTFTIVREYAGRLALHHVDAYRLEHLQEVGELGVAEMLDEPAVMLVEWGDAILPALAPEHLEVRITFGEGDDDRHLRLTTVGGRWHARRPALAEALARWADPTPDRPIANRPDGTVTDLDRAEGGWC